MNAGRTGWLDCASGVSGDMLLGALTDLGALDPTTLPALVGVAATVTVDRVHRAGIAAAAVSVTAADFQPARTLADLLVLLDAADLPATVRDRAAATLTRLATAEAQVHGTTVDHVHLHEVGAVDSLLDVVGACLGLHALGLDALHSASVALGGGTVRAAHGVLPVPGPAVVALLAGASVPAHGGPVEVELATPTGVALLAEHVTGWGPMPAMTPSAVGVGAGGRDLADRPNVLRLVVGAPATAAATQGPLLLTTNIDDLEPRLWPSVLAALLAAGASDAWLTPILMKKGRPAHTLSVLVDEGHADAARRTVFTRTTTLGLREQRVGKTVLDRALVTVEVLGEPVQVKVGRLDGEVVTVQPEWEQVAALAEKLGLAPKEVLAEATTAGRRAVLG